MSTEKKDRSFAIMGITIANFKGISAPVRIPLKPITLLFGPNSVGKSAIMHALQYFTEVLKRDKADPLELVMGDKLSWAGGFRGLVHGHDTTRDIVIKVDFSLGEEGIPERRYYTEGQSPRGDVQPDNINVNRLIDVESASIQISTGLQDGRFETKS